MSKALNSQRSTLRDLLREELRLNGLLERHRDDLCEKLSEEEAFDKYRKESKGIYQVSLDIRQIRNKHEPIRRRSLKEIQKNIQWLRDRLVKNCKHWDQGKER